MRKLIVLKKPNCMPCGMVRRFISDKVDDIEVENYNVESEDGMRVASHYGAMGAPTLIAVDANGVVLGETSGYKPDQITKLIEIVKAG